jgi:replicative DNA helicase
MEATNMRKPPQNVEAEQTLLGIILIQEKSLLKVAELLSPEDFYRDNHKLIYAAALTLFERNEPHDLVAVSSLLRDQSLLEQAGGIAYLGLITDVIPFTGTLAHHAKIIREKAVLRRLIQASAELAARCYDSQDDIDALVDKAEQTIFEVAQSKKKQGLIFAPTAAEAVGRRIDWLMQHRCKVTGVSTGLRDLDRITCGLQKSDLILVAARPGMGKTVLGMDFIRAASVEKNLVSLIFSLEMSHEQLAMRMVSAISGIDAQRIKTGDIDIKAKERLDWARKKIAMSSFYIDDTAGLTVLEMRAKARRLKAERDLGLVVVDYLQLMQGHSRSENRNQEISEISRSLKIMAKELDVPVVALAQLNRSLESRTDKRPILSDLRDSGGLEQDADVVIFIYREEKYNPCTCDGYCGCGRRGAAELIVAKHRNGPTGTVEAVWLGETTQFVDKWRGGDE